MELSKDPSVVQLQTEFIHTKKELKTLNEKVDRLIIAQDKMSKQAAMGAFTLRLLIGVGALVTWGVGVAVGIKHLILS